MTTPGTERDEGPAGSSSYERRARVQASAEQLFDAVTTLEGLRGWWTTLASGAPGTASSQVRFEFVGLDEHILMRVDELRRPSFVRWTCLSHTSAPEWDGTQVMFMFEPRDDGAELILRHVGLAPDWDHFFDSLVAFAETGSGTPFRAAGR